MSCSYNPQKNNISKNTEIWSKNLDLYSSQYENNIIIRDFNVGVNDPHMSDFCNAYNLSSLIKEPACYKNPENTPCIYLILTNWPRSFQGSCVVETGLSYFHKMVVTIMKTSFQRLSPKIRTCRNYNKFYNHKFRETLVKELSLANTRNSDISNFIDVCVRSLDKHTPLKKNYTHGDHLPFMNKEFSKAIMHRSKLRINFVRNRSIGESPETMRKLCLSTKFPHQEIRWNYGILRSPHFS